jgi:UDP-N-acetylmuramate dehydrogenase
MNFQPNYPLLEYNTFGIKEYAKNLGVIHDEIALTEAIQFAKLQETKLNIIGGGSNILLTKTLTGITIINKMKGITVISENEHEAIVCFRSGENWHECVLWAVEHQLGGIENLSLIPGTIGAAPIQNIGAYGVELKDVFVQCEAMNILSLGKKIFDLTDCNFGYRDSIFKQMAKEKYCILSVTLRLQKNAILKLDYGTIKEELKTIKIVNPSIKDVSDAVIRIRESKLPNPSVIGNAGSFFKNPIINKIHFEQLKLKFPEMPFFPSDEKIKIPAAWLIEQMKWKGFSAGDCGVHDKQALVLVNYGNATGVNIYELSTHIITSVQQQFNIELEREVNIW